MRVSHCLIGLSLSALPGCYTTHNVSTDALRATKGSVVVLDVAEHPVRIDPNSIIALHFRDGTTSAPLQARELRANRDALFHEVDVDHRRVSTVLVSGLAPADRALVAAEGNHGIRTLTEFENGELRLAANPSELGRWVRRSLIAIAKRDRRTKVEANLEDAPCLQVHEALLGPHEPSPHRSPAAISVNTDGSRSRFRSWRCEESTTYGESRALEDALARENGRVLGTWQVIVGAAKGEPLAGNDIGKLFHRSKMRDGVRWSDVESVDVSNVSGKTTLPAVVLTAGLIAAAAPALALAHDGHFGGDLGGAPPDPLASSNPIPNIGTSATGIARSAASPNEDEPWPKSTPLPADTSAEPLFTKDASRRAYVRLAGALEVGSDALSQRAISESAIVTLRLADIVEVGGGVSEVETRAGAVTDRSTLGLARIGLHAWFDQRQRFAVPLVIDLGRGGDVQLHARFVTGLRMAVTNALELSLYPAMPSWDSTSKTGSRWTVQSGVGASLSFF